MTTSSFEISAPISFNVLYILLSLSYNKVIQHSTKGLGCHVYKPYYKIRADYLSQYKLCWKALNKDYQDI